MDNTTFEEFKKIITSNGYLVDDFDYRGKILTEGPLTTPFSVNILPAKGKIKIKRISTNIERIYDTVLPLPWTKYFEQELMAGDFGKP